MSRNCNIHGLPSFFDALNYRIQSQLVSQDLALGFNIQLVQPGELQQRCPRTIPALSVNRCTR